MEEHLFVLSDESINSYDIKVITAGIDLSRFLKNPVMLDGHKNNTDAIIGRWEEVRKEDDRLLAKAVLFEDDSTKRFKKLLDGNFLKSASIGIEVLESVYEPLSNTVMVLRSELLEASLCAIPSNANALKLSIGGTEVSADQFKKSNQINHNMDEFIKKIAKLLHLSAEEKPNQEVMLKAVSEIKDQNRQLLEEKEQLLQALNTQKQQEIENIIDKALVEHKITASQKEGFVDLAANNIDLAKKVLSALKPYQTLAGRTSTASNSSEKTYEDLLKSDTAALSRLKKENPERYQELRQSYTQLKRK